MNEQMGSAFDSVVQHAIETRYREYLFRSRLEAKWACFFDLCDWKWSYEPVDMNGWIPDFVIGERPVYVEVKPFFNESEWLDQFEKIDKSGYVGDVICFGADATWWQRKNIDVDDIQIGWFRKHIEGIEESQVLDLHFGITECNGLPGLCTMSGAWKNIIWNETGKDARVWLDERDDVDRELVARWAKACNISRWMPSRKDSDGY